MFFGSEIPFAHLDEFSEVMDYDFALAHLVLENPAYAAFYAKQASKGRLVILDNSFHELGHPLPAKDLYKAAKTLKTCIVVSPDKFHDGQFTYDQFKTTHAALQGEFAIAAVITDPDPVGREHFISATWRKVQMYMFPFREPARVAWYNEAMRSPGFASKMVHFLGVDSLAELQRCTQVTRNRHTWVGFDTSKAFRYAYKREVFPLDRSLRGGGARESFNTEMNIEQRLCAFQNIALLRRASA